MKSKIERKSWLIAFLLLLVGVVKASNVLEHEIQLASKKTVPADTSHSLEELNPANGNDGKFDVRKPQIQFIPPSVHTVDFKYDDQDFDCCERCYVSKGCRCCANLWVVLRHLCLCLSCGASSNESCGMCTGCDCAEGSTRDKRPITERTRIENSSIEQE